MDWDIALKVTGVIFTVIGGLYHWHNIRFRSKLKADLEILKLYEAYGTNNPNFEALKNHVDKTIAKAYPSLVSNETKKIDKDGLVLASLNWFLADMSG